MYMCTACKPVCLFSLFMPWVLLGDIEDPLSLTHLQRYESVFRYKLDVAACAGTSSLFAPKRCDNGQVLPSNKRNWQEKYVAGLIL